VLGALPTGLRDRTICSLRVLRSSQREVALLDSAYRQGLNHLPITVQSLSVARYADLNEGLGNCAGIDLEHNLVRRLLQDAGQPDSLPLLGFAIWRLYDLHFEGPHADRGARLALQAPASK
jgi:hypothetical protein